MANADDFWTSLKAFVVARIQALNLQSDTLSGFGIGTNVLGQMLPDPVDNTPSPYVAVTYIEGAEELTESSTGLLEWYFPLRVWLCDRESIRRQDKDADYRAWMTAIKDAFHWRRFTVLSRSVLESGVGPQWSVWGEVKPEKLVEAEAAKLEMVCARSLARFRVCFPR